jgi:hypothetical protein
MSLNDRAADALRHALGKAPLFADVMMADFKWHYGLPVALSDCEGGVTMKFPTQFQGTISMVVVRRGDTPMVYVRATDLARADCVEGETATINLRVR